MIAAALFQWKQAVAQNCMRYNATKHVTVLGNSCWNRISGSRPPFLARSITHDVENKKSKRKDNGRQSYRFVDRTRVRVAGGTGGKASVSMFRMYRKMHRRPDGGHGGTGGSVVIVADPTEQTLRWTRPHVMAECGSNGSSQDKNGRSGKNLVIRVPCGVVVRRILEFDEGWDEKTKTVQKSTAGKKKSAEESWDDEDQEEGLFLAARFNEDEDDEDDSDDEDEDDSDDEDDGDDEDSSDSDDDNNETENKTREPPHREEKKVEMGDDGYFLNSDGLWELDKDYEDESYTPNDMERMASFVPWGDREKVTLADLDQPGSYVVVALGGKGGIGSSLYKGRNGLLPSPHIMARNATPQLGEMAALELELKLIADVGLVGFPNAGKSSLLAAMSRATPHIAPYPFTTLHPLVGYIEYRDGFKVCAADVPGLIAGASEGRGKGHDFLRHLERTKALLFIVDAAGVDGRDPISDLRILADELSAYGDGGMMDRNSLICANKMDLIKDEAQRKEIMLGLSSVAEESGIRLQGDILGISAGVTGEGLSTLSEAIRNVVKQTEAERRKTWEGDEARA